MEFDKTRWSCPGILIKTVHKTEGVVGVKGVRGWWVGVRCGGRGRGFRGGGGPG